MTDNKNQPAFPASRKYLTPDNDIFESYTEGGLTKREYAAIHLLAAICQNPNYIGGYLSAAKEAVKHADALIAELNNPTQQPKNP